MHHIKTELDNGITVISQHMDSVRTISLGLWFCVGSRDESPEEAGISHVLEHMMFKGTHKRSALDISIEFDSMGAESNAFTSKEMTCYYVRCIDTRLEKALDILSDMVINSTFDQHEVELEREVILEEIARSEDTPEDCVYENFSAILHGGHPLSKRVLGDASVVASMDHDTLDAYHKKYYVTGNMAVVAAGNVDHQKLVELVKSSFSGMKQGSRNVRTFTHEVDQKPLFIQHKETEQTHLIIGAQSLCRDDENIYVQALLTNILGGSVSSRLFQEIREKRGLVYTINAHTQGYTDVGSLCIYAGTRPDNLDELVRTTLAEINRMAQEGVTQEELNRSREYLIGLTTMSLESPNSHMLRLGHREMTDSPQIGLDAIIERYESITLEQANELACDLYTRPLSFSLVSSSDVSELEDQMIKLTNELTCNKIEH